MARKTNFAPGEFYHVYNRGTDRRKIFLLRSDYDRFLSLLYLSNSSEPVHLGNIRRLKSYRGSTSVKSYFSIEKGTPLVEIAAYCLMPNHFHVLVREIQEGGISRFMQKLVTGYTMYFNKRHERTGVLLQGKFRATHAAGDEYLKYLISYIHLNPVKLIDVNWKEHGIKDKKYAEKYLDSYKYSSYLDYCGKERAESMIIHKNILPDYFSTPKIFKESVTEWLTYKNTEVEPR